MSLNTVTANSESFCDLVKIGSFQRLSLARAFALTTSVIELHSITKELLNDERKWKMPPLAPSSRASCGMI